MNKIKNIIFRMKRDKDEQSRKGAYLAGEMAVIINFF